MLKEKSATKEAIKTLIASKIDHYKAIVIGEDKNISLFGVISTIQTITHGLLPVYIGKSVNELKAIREKLIQQNLKALYLLDNKYEPMTNEPQGQNLIKEWQVESDAVLITSDYEHIKNTPYPVFDKLIPEF